MRRHSSRKGLLVGLSVVLGLTGVACGKSGSAQQGQGGGGRAITITEGQGNSFTFSPATLTVSRGQTLTLENPSTTPHTFTVNGQGIDIETQPGATGSVTIDLPPGTYEFICRFHVQLGMKGSLVVK
ncbi:MAG TPA: cupredoxin domain-containing protein [Actinomycetota bacterium]|nr:cupredoxin domain-containing protein [Actinomycetota bacterium]